ncbi:exopolysaccharide production protein [Trabulsiella guamensis ATCC 49490]|uniref:Exopolysaccharide production protein n=1 Tax=Trabulsiella guamensis ATCC 49490 TaxID=1005994 RepID=A0A084ZU93_9ENTR|nr:acyltransferase [Trabulsiella guamensis]KFC01038.1 exopolysaccharide production protein [Trabulsiella guamensis ATCC 49490]
MRIQSIDYLRGLMSLSIVIYHFSLSFTNWGFSDSNTLLGRLGIYAVTAFYIISGMALYLAHRADKWSSSQYGIFIARRFLRLAPVYWVALIAFTVFYCGFVNGFTFDKWRYVQNIFLLFGITNPTKYMIMGGWSIGNEVVFYLFFPIFIVMVKNRMLASVLLVLSVLLLLYCSFFMINPSVTLARQWATYINPLNQVYYFIFGILAAKWFLPLVGTNKKICISLALLLFLIFILYPASGNQAIIIHGITKLVFSMITLGLCVLFFLMQNLQNIKPLHTILYFLGNVSYPLYLLHGVSFLYFRKWFFSAEMDNQQLIISGLILLLVLLVLSWLCHIGIEKPVIRLSKCLSNNKGQHTINTST